MIPREQITNVRIVPKGNHFVIEVLYDVEKPTVDASSYRQVNAVLKPYQTKKSKLLQRITKNRNYRIHDLFHKITTHLVNHLVETDVKVLIFGHNIGQKQDINLGSKTNQNFVFLPFTKLILMLQYKCKRFGIRFIVTEESYTSKCSFLDLESIEHHDDYVGRRVKRGLFKSANGTCINADINGSLNIGRKYLTSVNQYSDQLHSELVAHMSNPRRVNIVLN